MPRKKKADVEKEQEALSRQISTNGNDPNPAVNALMSEDFLSMSNFDASQIALVLQQIVRGQNSLLTLAQQNSDDIARLKAQQARIDKETAERYESQKHEIEDILNRAEKLKLKGDKKDRVIAKGVKQYQNAVTQARASKTVDKLQFEKKLAAEPQEYVVAHGQLVTTIENGQQVAKILPEEIRIKHKVWLLQPGVPTKVPQSVAETLRNRYQSQEETNKLKEMLSKHMHANKLAQQWNETKGSGSMPLVPG